jgi:hypothetical protein
VTARERWLAGLVALLVAVLIGGGVALLLGNDDTKEISASATTTSSPSTTNTSETQVTVGIICTTPEDATTSLVDAWIAGEKAAAARCAASAVVDELFKNNGAGAQWTFQGCSGDPGVPTCSYSYEGGGANFVLNGTEAGGWKVVDVTFIAD